MKGAWRYCYLLGALPTPSVTGVVGGCGVGDGKRCAWRLTSFMPLITVAVEPISAVNIPFSLIKIIRYILYKAPGCCGLENGSRML